MITFKKVDTLRTTYNHELKTYSDEVVPGYKFTAEMESGRVLTLWVRKCASGKTWEVVDANMALLICSLFDTRQRAAAEAVRRVRTLSDAKYEDNVRRFQQYLKNYSEVEAK